jgi:uncharacterized protein
MTGVEFRSTANGELVLSGFASVYGVEYSVGGMFTEVMKPGCARRSISDNVDCSLLIEHAGLALARTRSPTGGEPTLKLSEPEERGLFCEGRLDPRNPKVQELRSVSEHTGVGMSVGMEVHQDNWNKDLTYREIGVATFCDVTACTYPANPATGAQIDERAGTYKLSREERSAFVAGMKGQVERRMCPGFEPPILEARSKYAAHELGELGAQGMAFKRPDGGWSFPTKTKGDFDEATKMVQLAPASQQAAIRKYLMARAKAEGWRYPANWSKDGSARSAELIARESRWEEQDLELRASVAGVPWPKRSTGIARQIEAANRRDGRELDALRRRIRGLDVRR